MSSSSYNSQNFSSVPNNQLFTAILDGKATESETQAYLQALKQYMEVCPNGPGEEYFTVVDQHSRVELRLNHIVDFDEPKELELAPAPKATNRLIPAVSREQLVAEIDQLIDENPSESKLAEVLPFLAKLAGISPRDIQTLYAAKLAELEASQSPEELKRDVDELLAIGGESLNLYEFLPPTLAEPLIRLADRMQARPEVFLLTLLTAISTLHKVGTNLTISAEDKFIVPPNLFSGIVAESGQKKSPILRTLVKYPLDALRAEANSQIRAQHEEDLDEWNSCTKEERGDQFPDGKPNLQLIEYYFNDGTVEGINRQFSRFPQRGMLYLRDELAGVFAYNKYQGGKGSERQDFLSFYDGFGKKELRAEGFVSRVEQVLVSIFGTIQPEILRQLMQDPLDADGQWARFLFVIQPLQPAKLRQSGNFDINRHLLNPLYQRIDELPAMRYELASDAFDYYALLYDKLEKQRCADPDPAMRAVFSKTEGTIGRLAINLHVLHELMGREQAAVSQLIPKLRILQASKLARFFVNQLRLIRAAVNANASEGEIAPHLAAIVERSQRVGAIKARDVQKGILAFRHSSTQEIRGYFRSLAELGYGTCSGSGTKMIFTANTVKYTS